MSTRTLVASENVLSRTEEKLVEMSNGCICCTLREDLMEEVERLAREERFDYLLIESTGISEPIPVAQTFSFVDEDNGIDLSAFSYVDTMVTVVDAANFFNDFGSPETLEDRELTDIEGDDRTIVNLLTDQVEFANVIILNKIDMVSEEHLGILRGTLQKLNPGAQIVETNFSEVNPTRILNTGLFDFEEAEESAGWIEEHEQRGAHPRDGGIWHWLFCVPNKTALRPRTLLAIFSNQVSIQHHSKQGAVLDSLATQPSLDLGASGRIDSNGQRGVVVEQHAFLFKDSIPLFRREPGRHRKGMGPPLRRSEN